MSPWLRRPGLSLHYVVSGGPHRCVRCVPDGLVGLGGLGGLVGLGGLGGLGGLPPTLHIH